MSDESRAASMPKAADPTLERIAAPAVPAVPAADSDPTGESLVAAVEPAVEVPARASVRPRMALRIPDDEVARPLPRVVEAPERKPVSDMPPPSDDRPVFPQRIITINPPAPPPPAPEPDDAEDAEDTPLPVTPPIVPAPASAAAPLEDGWSSDDDRPTPVPVKAVVEPDGEEVRFEEDAPTPALPPVMAQPEIDEPEIDEGRRSEPGDAPEISPEDLVAVESVPARTSVRPVLPPKKTPPKPPLVIVPPHVGALVAQSVDTPGSRRKGRLWWEDFFNDDYVRTMEKITDAQIGREVAFIEESLGVERGGTVLDLGCGTGRHAVELATRGYEVVGFDLSLAMLSRAGDEAQDRGVKLNFVQGDMRDMSFEEQFDGVFCWNTTFGYFEEEKNVQVVAKVHRALKAGGMFLLDVINRDFLVRQSPSLAWFEGDGCVCMDDMNVDFITSRMRVKRTMMFDDGRTREVEYSIRTYGLHELGKILHDGGFKVCEVSGRLATPGVYFGNESPRTLIVAEKR
jgi:SAM-dependent methyltransferase